MPLKNVKSWFVKLRRRKFFPLVPCRAQVVVNFLSAALDCRTMCMSKYCNKDCDDWNQCLDTFLTSISRFYVPRSQCVW